MKTLVSATTLAIAAALMGCNSDGSMRNASNDDSMNRDSVAQGSSNNGGSDMAGQTDIQLRSGSDKMPVSISKNDQIFLTDATTGGIFEVEAGQKALAKSSDDRVKMIAQHLVDDHKKANDQLAALDQRKGMKLGTLPNADQIAMLAKLDGLSGSDFDREYLAQQRKAHEDAISMYQTASASADDRDIRNFAAQSLPMLRNHLDMINNRIDSNVGMEK